MSSEAVLMVHIPRRTRRTLICVCCMLGLAYYVITMMHLHKAIKFDEFVQIISDDAQYKSGKPCIEKRNFAFIKCMKCATETTMTILRTFGYVRNLSFVLPVANKIYLGWPFKLKKEFYRTSTKVFNILVEHAIYSKEHMSRILSRDTVYMTFIREPFSHFASVFHYFELNKNAKINSDNPITEYLHNIDKYETIYKSHESAKTRHCVPDDFSITKNLQAHCLGMPLGFPTGTKNISVNHTAVKNYIAELDKDFSLVMIVEYFHESLILMRRFMCWNLKDIFYKRVNFRSPSSTDMQYKTKENKELHRRWSGIDYALYNYFNATFWQKVDSEGRSFHDEVAYFTSQQNRVDEYCKTRKNVSLYIEKSAWNKDIIYTTEDCKHMDTYLLVDLKIRYDKNL